MQQSLAEFTKEAGSMSGGQSYMQQNTRLVVLTLEVCLPPLGTSAACTGTRILWE